MNGREAGSKVKGLSLAETQPTVGAFRRGAETAEKA